LKIPPRQLKRHLEGKLAPVYLVAGDEPLLVAEALDDVRDAARRAGYEERELHAVDKSFRWDDLLSGADNLSLFASRKIVELRLASPRPGDAGARALRAIAERPDPDRLLIVAIAGRIDAAAKQSQWLKAIDKAGAVVEVWPIERAELPRWVRERAARYRLKPTASAAELLADRVEGNLLAADQELMKLALSGAHGDVDDARVLEAVADSARFDVFRLTDAALAGDAGRAIRVLAGLRTEGVQPVLVSWALGREISLVTTLKFAVSNGESLDAALGRQRVWPRRRPVLEKALRRLEWRQLTALLTQAVEVDGIVKGAGVVPPWDALTRLVVSLAESRRPPGVRAA